MNPVYHEDYAETPLAVPVTVYGGIEASMADLPEAEPAVPIPHGRTHHQEPAAMRNLYSAAISYDGFIITDGALRLIVLLHATALGFNAIEIAFMFSMYEVSLPNFNSKTVHERGMNQAQETLRSSPRCNRCYCNKSS